MAIIASTLAGIKSDPLSFLGGAERVNACFAHAWRDRLLDPAKTIALFVRQILHGNAAISELRHLSVTDVADSSSYTGVFTACASAADPYLPRSTVYCVPPLATAVTTKISPSTCISDPAIAPPALLSVSVVAEASIAALSFSAEGLRSSSQ